ncbi:phage tail tape measure protein [Silvimonas soli]|uniref:phage tail tape measure protein n=1 Tax=Silvimonas soli TaxID=2980100 RepID=UPI0024B35748|nr:phage tail tape measure protein [Silvimonas soli]
MGGALGNITVDLTANTAGFDSGLSRSDYLADRTGTNIARSLGRIDGALAALRQNGGGVERTMLQANRAVAGMRQTSEQTARAVGDVSTSIDKLVSSAGMLGKLSLGVLAGGALVGSINEAALLAARYNTLGAAEMAVGANAGYSRAQLYQIEQQLRATGISAIESRSNITKLVQAHVDLSKASQLARIAQDAAVIGNLNSSEAFGSLVHGIQSANVEVLRNVGINVSFEQSYKAMAKSLGVTTEQLTEQDKLQARVNVVMDAGTTIAGTYQAAMGEAGKQLQSNKRYLEDLKVSIGQNFMGALSAGANTAATALKALNANGETIGIAMAAMAATTAGALGGRLVSSIQASATAMLESRAASVAAADGALQLASADTARAGASLTAARTDQSAAVALLEKAGAEVMAAQQERLLAAAEVERTALQARLAAGTAEATAANTIAASSVARLAAAETALTAALQVAGAAESTSAVAATRLASANAEAAISAEAHAVAERSLAVASTTSGAALSAGGAVLSALGGPIGITIIALSALAMNWTAVAAAAGDAAAVSEQAATRIRNALAMGDEATIKAQIDSARKQKAQYEALAKARGVEMDKGGFASRLAASMDPAAMDAAVAGNNVVIQNAKKGIEESDKIIKQGEAALKSVDAQRKASDPAEQANQRLQMQLDGLTKTLKTKGEKLKEEQAVLNDALAKGLISKADYEEQSHRLEEKYKEKAQHGPKTPAGDRYVDRLDERIASLTAQSAATDKLTASEKELAEFESKLKAGRDPSLARDADAIRQRLQTAAQLERQEVTRTEAQKEINKQLEKEEKLRSRIVEVNREMADYSQGRDQTNNRETETFGMGDDARKFVEQLNTASDAYQRFREKLTKNLDGGVINSQAYTDALQQIDAAEQAQLAREREYHAQWLDMESSWANGATRALANYQESAANVAQQTQELFGRAFSGMEDALVTFATTGKLNFKSLAESIISDLIRIQMRAQMSSIFGTLLNMGMSAMGDSFGSDTGPDLNANLGLGYDAANSTASSMAAPAGQYDWIGRADGGPVVGAGGGTADKVPMLASNGEYVISTMAVQHYGPEFMAAINQRQYQPIRRASGGPVGSVGGGLVSLDTGPRSPVLAMAGANSAVAGIPARASATTINLTQTFQIGGGEGSGRGDEKTEQKSGDTDSTMRQFADRMKVTAFDVIQTELRDGGLIWSYLNRR